MKPGFWRRVTFWTVFMFVTLEMREFAIPHPAQLVADFPPRLDVPADIPIALGISAAFGLVAGLLLGVRLWPQRRQRA